MGLDLGPLLGLPQLRDALSDELRLDAPLEGLDLAADALVEVGDLIAQVAVGGL
jgi:hypothetical protein